MKNVANAAAGLALLAAVLLIGGCKSQEAVPSEAETVQTAIQTSQSYYLLTDSEENSAMIPCLTMFDNGTYGFTYDVISSYYARGSYTIEDGKLTARTDDGRAHYTFAVEENGDLVFAAEESSDLSLIDKDFGIPIVDGSVFRQREEQR